MSYILDALRRADAERERGAVPDLHAQPLQTATPETEVTRSSPPWLWLALGLLVALVLALAWRVFAGGSSTSTVATQAAATPQTSPQAQMSAPTSQAQTQAQPQVQQGAAAATGNSPGQVPAPSAALPTQFPSQALSDISPAPREQKPAARTDAKPGTPPAPAQAAGPSAANANAGNSAGTAPAAAATVPPTASTEERIYALTELPDDIRRSLPALPIGGSTYSQNAASRMLIVNGQVFHEGDSITPDLKLEQIRLKGAVLRFRGYRYSITF